jgi:peptidoglycan/LPS O-acetylase OafA/YrhL
MPEATITLPNPQRATGHLAALDGVRGLAILMVIFSHAFEANYEAGGALSRFMGHLFYYGLFGVDLFFVLSGFLITGILFDSLDDDGYFRKFYARRALRIFPLYYGVLLICFLLTRPLHLHWGDMGWLLVFYLQNLHPATIVAFSPGRGIALFHFWSLAIEEQFYLLWPAAVFFLRNKRSLLLATLVGSAAALLLRLGLLAAGASGFAVHVTTICRADSLLLGGALALLYRSARWADVIKLAPSGFWLAAATLILTAIVLDPYLVHHDRAGLFWRDGLRYTILALGFSCLIACALRPGSAFERVFQSRWLSFLGKYSYGLYVLHVFALAIVGSWLRPIVLAATHSKLISVGFAGVGSIAVAIAAAYLSYHLYERPFLRFKHHFDYARKTLNHSSPEDATLKQGSAV